MNYQRDWLTTSLSWVIVILVALMWVLYWPISKVRKHRHKYDYTGYMSVGSNRIPRLQVLKFCKRCNFKRYGTAHIKTWHS